MSIVKNYFLAVPIDNSQYQKEACYYNSQLIGSFVYRMFSNELEFEQVQQFSSSPCFHLFNFILARIYKLAKQNFVNSIKVTCFFNKGWSLFLISKGFQQIKDLKKLQIFRLNLMPTAQNSLIEKKTLHCLTMKKTYIHQIKQGKKTVEGRIYTGRIAKYKIGDELRFYYLSNAKDDVKCIISNINVYKTFEQMLKDVGVEKLLPEISSFDEAVTLYGSIPKYKDKAAQFGVAAIYLIKK